MCFAPKMTLVHKDGTVDKCRKPGWLGIIYLRFCGRKRGWTIEGPSTSLQRPGGVPLRGTFDPWLELRTFRLCIENYTSTLGQLPPLASYVLDLLMSVARGHSKLRSDAVHWFTCTDGNPDTSLEYLQILPAARSWKHWEPTKQPQRFVLRTTYYVQGASVVGVQPSEMLAGPKAIAL
jgi:hypothetical protein